MKLRVKGLFLLVASSLTCLPSLRIENAANNNIITNKKANVEDVIYDENNSSFDYYSSVEQQFILEGGVLHSPATGESKAVLQDFSSNNVDASFVIAPKTFDGAINGGFYIHAKNPGNGIDHIDAFNVQIEKAVGNDHYRVALFDFKDSAFAGCIANTVEFAYKNEPIKLRVTADTKEINVFLNDSDVPSLNKKIASFGKDGMSVGFRSMGAEQFFGDFKISSKIVIKEIPTVKVLMVGNSYAQDTMTYAHEIAASQGVNMVCGVIYYGGCTFKQHTEFIASKGSVYKYFKNGGTDKESATFDDILFDEDWDYISIQTGAGNQGLKDTYYPYLQKIIAYVEHNCPRAEVGLFQSWAVPSCYEGSNNSRLGKYGDSAEAMYEAIIKVTKEVFLEEHLDFLVGSAEAMHRINQTSVCDDSVAEKSFNRDSTGHLNENGRYMMGMLMYKTITGMDVNGVNYLPYGNSYGEAKGTDKMTSLVIKEVVQGMFDDYQSMNHLVDPKKVVKLETSNYQKNYQVGDYFAYEDLIVYAVYEDGRKEETNYFTIDLMRELTLADNEITISYKGIIIKLPITVSAKS